ncbi:MAG: GldG family protein [Mariprofundaceae bacterium]
MVDFRQLIRRSVYGRLAVSLFVLTGLFALSNLSQWRMDWTEDQVYSLSPATKSLLGSLQEPVFIHAYMSSGMPQPYGRLQQFVQDMLLSYHEAGAGYVDYKVVDPADDVNVSAALTALNVPKLQVQVIHDDRAEIKQGYLAIVVEYLDKKEVITALQSEQGFEYQLTQKIKKLTGAGRLKIALSSSFGARSLAQLGQLSSLLTDDYEWVAIDMQRQAVPSDVQAVIVAAMDQAPSLLWRFHLDQFRMRGGGLLVLAAAANPDLTQGFAVQAVAAQAHDWIAEDLAVSIESGLVMDQRAQRIVVENGMFRSQVDYPFVMDVVDLARNHGITRNLKSVSIPFASPLLAHHHDMKVLLRSSKHSAVQDGPDFDVYPLLSLEKRFEGHQLGASILALYHEGQMQSAFRKLPTELQSNGAMASRLLEQPHGRLIVSGSSALLNDEFLESSTAFLVMNMVDWLAGNESLMQLRSRSISDRPLLELSDAGRTFFKVLWIFTLPVMMTLLGLWHWRRIRKSL